MLYAVGACEGASKQEIADMNPLVCVPKTKSVYTCDEQKIRR